MRSLLGHVIFFVTLSLVGESWKGAVRMQEEKAVENKENYIDGGNFKARIGNTAYLVGVFFNKAKKGNSRGQSEESDLSGSGCW